MFKKIIKRKWLVNLGDLDISKYESTDAKIGVLSQEYDSLSVIVKNIGEDYTLDIIDGGYKQRNCISYNISHEEFLTSIILSGNKNVSYSIYDVPSTKQDCLITVKVFSDFAIAEYEHKDELVVDTLLVEDWFVKEVTDDSEYYLNKIVLNKKI